MTPRVSELESKVAQVEHELELSTLLNKGILQSNQEYKLRIAELEAANSALRAAESRLSTTEDAFEVSEKRVKELEKDRAVVLREKRRLEEQVEALVSERDGWKARFEGVKSYWGSILGGMADIMEVRPPQPAAVPAQAAKVESASKGRKSIGSANATAGPVGSVKRPATKPRSSNAKDKSVVPEAEIIDEDFDLLLPRPRRKRFQVDYSLTPGTEEMDDNSDLLPSKYGRKKRKVSSSPANDDASHSPSPPLRPRTPSNPRSRKSLTAQASSKRPSATKEKTEDRAKAPKREPLSPEVSIIRRPKTDTSAADESDDDDPLAMS